MQNPQIELFVRTAPILIAMFDRDMRYVATSASWVSKYERSSDLDGQLHYELHPNIPMRWKEAHQRGLSGETVIGKDDEHYFPTGKRWMDWSVTPWRCEANGGIGGVLIIANDLFPLKQEEKLAKEKEGQFHDLLAGVPLAYQSLDIEGCWLDANQSMADLLGFEHPEQMIGMHFTDFWAKETKLKNPFDMFKQSGHLNDEQTLVRRDGKVITIMIVGRIERDVDGKFVRTHCFLFDVTKRKRFEEELLNYNEELERKVAMRTKELAEANRALEELVRRDPLTGIYNRLAAEETLRIEFARMKRTRVSYAIMVLDIDFFKNVNDTYGHAVGDVVLRSVAHTVLRNLRRYDFVARYGGEEFFVLLPSTDSEQAYSAAEKIRASVENLGQPFEANVTVSIGVALASPDHLDETVAVREADNQLYEAKRSGRNRISCLL
jgi:diguanylate cyclase (GGDEF)-like protein/PAS domain S-box-containing protein